MLQYFVTSTLFKDKQTKAVDTTFEKSMKIALPNTFDQLFDLQWFSEEVVTKMELNNIKNLNPQKTQLFASHLSNRLPLLSWLKDLSQLSAQRVIK